MSATVPHDLEAERAVIGAMLLFPGRDDEAVELLEPEDFYDTCCAEAFRILRTSDRRSRPMDVIALRDALASRDRHVTTEWLADVTTLAAASCRSHAETIAGFKARRDGLGVVAEAVKAFRGREDPLEVRDRTVEALQRLRSYLPAPPDDLSVIEDLLRQDVDQLDPWVIPGLMRRGWRCVFVAGEGIGKSTLLRQFAVTASQGIHPLGLMEMPHTCRVLLVDLENSVQKLVRDVRKMQKLVPEWTSGTLRVWHRPQGVDIRTRHGRNELEAAIDAATPSLVLLSPAYKLYRKGRDSDEDAVAEVQQIIDDLRVRYGFATIIEHHAPHGNNGARDMRPFGTSWWLRWPELGFGFEPETPGDSTSLKITRWRGDRDTNSWPVAIEHGTGWPWVGRWADDSWRHEQEAMV